MYSENNDFEENYDNENTNGSFVDKAKDFYVNNKKLVLILGGLLLLIIFLLMVNSCSNNATNNGGNSSKIELSLNTEKSYLGLGNTVMLVAETNATGNISFVWTSSNPEVAKIDSLGNVTALKIGSTLITVSIEHKGTTYTKACEIIVIEGDEGVEITEVSFPEGELLITRGDKFKVSKVVTPSNGFIENIVFTSSNTGIIDVDDNGNIKALEDGVAILKMSVNDGKFKDELTVNVVSENIEPQFVFYPSMIAFDQPKITLIEGDNKELEIQTVPTNAYLKNLHWSSSNISVATVDEEGTINAIGVGSTIITVTAPNDVTAQIVIEVESAIINVTNVDILTSKSLTLNVGDSSVIIPNVLPANASDKSVTYSSSNSNIAFVDNNGNITAISSGVTVITVTTNDGLKTATVVVTVNGNSSGGSSSGGNSSGGSSSGGSSSGGNSSGGNNSETSQTKKTLTSIRFIPNNSMELTINVGQKIPTLMAHYSDGTDKIVDVNNIRLSNLGTISNPSAGWLKGTQVITTSRNVQVSYTEGGITKTISLYVTVKNNTQGGSSSTEATYNFTANFDCNDVFYYQETKYTLLKLSIDNKSTNKQNAIYFCVDENSSTAKSPSSAQKYHGYKIVYILGISDKQYKDFYAQPSKTCNRATGLSSGYWNTYMLSGAKVCAHVEVDGVRYKEKCFTNTCSK